MDNAAIPEKFGEYTTLRDDKGHAVVLGSGGFGTTVCAYRTRELGPDMTLRDDYAVKILRIEAIEDPKRRRAFVNEIVALRDLQHPNLVRYIDCGEQGGSIFMVMDLCRGGDLERIVRRLGRFRERAALQTILQLCAGLDEAHRTHYLHRDLKPRNVLLSEALPPDASMAWLEEGLANYRVRFKIVDFGLAGKLGGEIRNSGFVGSPMFASPEQVREKRDLDFRSDIYSLGMTLWYLVTGAGPLMRPDGKPINDAREAMKAHTSPTPHDLAFPTALHPEFRQLLSRMVRKSREERFGRVDELIPAIRAVLDRMPATVPISVAAPLPPVPEVTLPEQPEWAKGTLDELFEMGTEVGPRPMGKQVKASLKAEMQNPFVLLPKGTEVALTTWGPSWAPEAENELRLARHLSNLWSVSWAHTAPASLARILDVRRTSQEWGVSEEWSGGMTLEAVLTGRAQPLKVEEAAALLAPVAEAIDFLREKKVERAPVSIGEIRLFREGATTEGEAWPQKPMDSWGGWGVHVSALTVPADLTEVPGETVGAKYLLMKAFGRLFYRMMEGVEAAEAADADATAYVNSTRLKEPTNDMLKDCISGARGHELAMDFLQTLCESEGLSEIPMRVEQGNTRGPFGASSFASGSMWMRDLHRHDSEVDPNDPSISSVMNTVTIQPLPGPPGGAGGQMAEPVASAHVSSYSSGSSFGSPWAGPPVGASASMSASASSSAGMSQGGITFEEAELVAGSPGQVRSPYGGRNQQWISGPDWRPGARVLCETTFRLFQLPPALPPLPANLLDGRFDAVLSPYVDPPQVIGVPLGRWRPGEEFICSYTKLAVVMPMELPRAEGTPVDGKSGVVRSPYGSHVEFPVAPAFWRPAQILTCPESNQELMLPGTLPPLHANPTESAGCFTSPYAPTQRFTLYPRECTPGFAFECPNSGNRLVVPPSLPSSWRFEGRVRGESGPEAKSPFLEMGEDFWQPVDMANWHRGGVAICARTQREFGLPARLPALPVRPSDDPPAVLSPFPPHESVRIPGKSWYPGAELTINLANGVECKVVLEAESLAPLAAIPTETAGVFTSPYAPDSRFAVPPPNCVGGFGVICPSTQRKLVVPTELPRQWWFEGQVRQTEVPESRSPFVADEDRAWQPVAAEDWGPGARATCHITRREFHLPSPLPPLKVRAGSRPFTVVSPFPPHALLPVPEAQWVPSIEISVRLSSGDQCRITLPADLSLTEESAASAEQNTAAPIQPAPIQSAPAPAPAPRPAAVIEAVVVSPGQVRSFSTGATFSISGEHWIPGAPVTSPSGEALRLPSHLPALTALLGVVPGIVRSPYVAQPTDQRVPPSLWQAGMEIPCAMTGRKMRLPDMLPSLGVSAAPSTGPSLLIPAILVGICLLGLIALAVMYFTHK